MLHMLISLPCLMELHWFQLWVFESLLGMAKFFKHLDMPNLTTICLILLLNPRKYSATDLYPPSHHTCTPFGTITKLHLKASHYTPGKPARNNLIFHGWRVHKTLFSIYIHCASVIPFYTAADLALTSSLHVNVVHLTQLTLSSTSVMFQVGCKVA